MSKFAYHKELNVAGTFYFDAKGRFFFQPITDNVSNNRGVVRDMEVVRDVLLVAAEIIPLLIRLWLMIFGNKEKKEAAFQHHLAAAKIRQAKKKVK